MLRGALASTARTLPAAVPGRARAGLAVQRVLTDYGDDSQSIVWTRMRDGSRIRVDLRTRTEQRAYWTGHYDHDAVRRLARFLADGDAVVDAGANIGFYAVPLGRRLRDAGGEVWAIEPVAANASRLLENVRANGLDGTVTVIRAALGDAEGETTLRLEAGERTGNATPSPDGTGESVPLRTLDSIAESEGIRSCALLKLDVEGSELTALRGASRFLALHRPVIVAELNTAWMQALGWSLSDLLAFVEPLGYDARRGDAPYGPLAEPLASIDTALLVPRDSPLEARARDYLLS